MKLERAIICGMIFGILSWSIEVTCSRIVLEVRPSTSDHLNVLRSIENDQIIPSDLPQINITSFISIHNPVDSLKIRNLLTRHNIQFRDDTRFQAKHIWKRNERSNKLNESYLTGDEFENWIQSIKLRNHPLVGVDVIGKSFEGRNIYSIKIGRNVDASNILIESGNHAREWLSVASVIGTINMIVKDLTENDKGYWKPILDQWTIYFVPLLNPDGYIYSMQNQDTRFWRKNRQTLAGSECSGVDLNRNFPIGFQKGDSSCKADYTGPAPFSTPEARSLRNIATAIKDKLKLYISFHCFGQFILLPWAYTNLKLKDYSNMEHFAFNIRETIFRVGQRNFSVGTPGELLYTAGGTSFDWIKSLGVPYSYTIELSPEQDSGLGFMAPEEFIRTSIEEVHASLKTAITNILL